MVIAWQHGTLVAYCHGSSLAAGHLVSMAGAWQHGRSLAAWQELGSFPHLLSFKISYVTQIINKFFVFNLLWVYVMEFSLENVLIFQSMNQDPISTVTHIWGPYPFKPKLTDPCWSRSAYSGPGSHLYKILIFYGSYICKWIPSVGPSAKVLKLQCTAVRSPLPSPEINYCTFLVKLWRFNTTICTLYRFNHLAKVP